MKDVRIFSICTKSGQINPLWLNMQFFRRTSDINHHSTKIVGYAKERTRFLFRTMAGILLGLLMWWRGFGVCVYTHTLYDVHYYLTQTA